ncbi:thioredoxin-disulfide reductase [Georgenia yuyongxinii]|uniref:Thioredoxin reductase n=2 Tax=Georgenia yuyongxinii TaxID=2589797 RepID=A0A5B8BYC7_9MICO|nr:thioredoxin-disulfide reductase [Georgenia yuyongxinii]
MSPTVRAIAIIGSGPAGYTAALYAARANLAPLVFEGSVSSGGALMSTTGVENFPGFPGGIQGPDLMALLRQQAAEFGAELVTEDVVEVDLAPAAKRLRTESGVEYDVQAVIVATGAGYRELGLADERRLTGYGVSWCATCDGAFYKEKEVAVVGGGDSALEEALFLTRFARSVTVVHRRDTLRASAVLQDRARDNPRISFAWNKEIIGLRGQDRLTGVQLADARSGDLSEVPADGLFVAIGHLPRSDLFRDQLELTAGGHIRVQSPTTATSVPGVFACGDVVDALYRQAITAAGSGCAAALDAQRFLAGLETPVAGSGFRPTGTVASRPAEPVRPATEEATMVRGSAVETVTDASFAGEVLDHDKPVLVDFWATWCSACQLMFPALADFAREYEGLIAVKKVDVDESPVTAEKYDIGSMPTLKLFRGGEVVHTIVGAKTKSSLVAELSQFLPARTP